MCRLKKKFIFSTTYVRTMLLLLLLNAPNRP